MFQKSPVQIPCTGVASISMQQDNFLLNKKEQSRKNKTPEVSSRRQLQDASV
jgi:hypothetical protein